MKKLLLLALVGMFTISAQAAAIAWSSTAISFDGVTLKNNASVVGYLIALEGSNLEASYALTEGFSLTTIGTLADTCSGSKKSGKVTGTPDLPYTNGDSFALLITYTDGVDTYYNLSSTINTFSGLDPNDITVFPEEWNDFAINGAAAATDGTLTAGGGWTKAAAPAVPEPASAMLALAGVAMLIRRRKYATR